MMIAVRFLRRRNGVDRPQTVAGQWLRAVMLNLREERNRVGRQLGGPAGTWRDDEAAVGEFACGLFIHEYFAKDASVEDLNAFAERISPKTSTQMARRMSP